MTTATTTRSAVYVGTYAKYNSGSIDGDWLDLEEYSDKETFIAACQELHKDEADPELMFQDWEGIPSGMISESHIDTEVFAWLDLDEREREILTVYRDNINDKGTIDEANDACRGVYDSPEDYAEQFHDEMGGLKNVPSDLIYHIDWKSVARDMGHNGTTFVEVGYQRCFVFID
jgi:antirestriction protein